MSTILQAYLKQNATLTTVSNEAFEQATHDLASIAKEREAIDVAIEDMATIQDDLSYHLATADDYVATLSAGLESGNFSQQHLHHAQRTLAHLQGLFDITPEHIGLEVFGNDQLADGYTASLEGFKEIVEKLQKGMSSVMDKIREGFSLFGTNDKAADALKKKLTALKQKETFEKESVTFPLGPLVKTFNNRGATVSNVCWTIGRDVKAMTYLAEKHMDALVKWQLDVLSTAVGMDQRRLDLSHFTNTIMEKSANDKVPEDLRNGIDLMAMRVSQKSVTITGDFVDDLLAFKAKIVHEKKLFEHVRSAKEKDEAKMSAAQAKELLGYIDDYITLLSSMNRATKQRLHQWVNQHRALMKKAQEHGNAGNWGTQHAVATREMATCAEHLAKATMEHFNEISKVLEARANACMALYTKACHA